MNITDAKTVLTAWMKDVSYPPLILVGAAGIGKTQVVTDSSKGAEKHLEMIRMGSLDSPGDLLGLPQIINDVTTFSKVEMFERLKNGGVIFVDEVNRCKPVMLDSMMQILDMKRLATYDLSNCVVVGAMNPDTDDYSVTEMDKAVIDRCLFIKVENSSQEVANYFSAVGMDDRIPELALLAEHNLKVNGNYTLPQKELTPRGLRQLATILPLIDSLPESVGLELINACVGPNGVATWKNKSLLKEIPSAATFLTTPDDYKVETMEPLVKRILLHRVNNFVSTNKPKESKVFTGTILRFGKVHLGYVLRHLEHIRKRMNNSDEKFAEMAKEILETISN